MYKVCIICPTDEKVIDQIINVASNMGAGVIGNYSRCAFVSYGTGTWKSEEGAHPAVGEVGEVSKEALAKIEMVCPDGKLKQVKDAIKKVHPFEEPDIDFLKLEVV